MKEFYEFDHFRLDVRERLFWRGKENIPLTPKIFELLLAFVENHGRVLEKEEIFKRLWPESKIVDDANLSRSVFILRKAMGDGESGLRYIETVSRRGYRFTAQVILAAELEPAPSTDEFLTEDLSADTEMTITEKTVEAEKLPATLHAIDVRSYRKEKDEQPALLAKLDTAQLTPPFFLGYFSKRFALIIIASILMVCAVSFYVWLSYKPRPTSLSNVRSIAVLPFKHLNADQNDDHLGLGLCDALITRLGNIKTITVRPTSAVRRFTAEDADPAAIGRMLKVDAVLEGRIQKTENQVRITIQLINSADGTHLWADKFDEQLTDVLAFEDRVSEKLTAALMLKLSGEETGQITLHHAE